MMFELDCSLGEGGGSLIRISVALAAAANIKLKLHNIRANRPNPGLRAQHIEAINAIQQLSGISTKGTELGSQTLIIEPGRQKNRSASVNISTAGSIALVAQAVMYYSITQGRDIDLFIKGGATHGKWAPSVEYVENITHSYLLNMKKEIKIKINQYGFYPKGGSNCSFSFSKHNVLSPLNLTERGSLEKIDVFSIASHNLENKKVAERQFESFVKRSNPRIEVIPHVKYVKSISPGTGLTAINEYSSGARIGCFVPGEKKITAEFVGNLCSKKWQEIEESSAAVDEYATDQLIIPLSMLEGHSVISTNKITNHTKTNIELAKKFSKAIINIKKKPNCYFIDVKNK
jgi:RNA 3'-terminal phosphate cyclase (ATP)